MKQDVVRGLDKLGVMECKLAFIDPAFPLVRVPLDDMRAIPLGSDAEEPTSRTITTPEGRGAGGFD